MLCKHKLYWIALKRRYIKLLFIPMDKWNLEPLRPIVAVVTSVAYEEAKYRSFYIHIYVSCSLLISWWYKLVYNFLIIKTRRSLPHLTSLGGDAGLSPEKIHPKGLQAICTGHQPTGACWETGRPLRVAYFATRGYIEPSINVVSLWKSGQPGFVVIVNTKTVSLRQNLILTALVL